MYFLNSPKYMQSTHVHWQYCDNIIAQALTETKQEILQSVYEFKIPATYWFSIFHDF